MQASKLPDVSETEAMLENQGQRMCQEKEAVTFKSKEETSAPTVLSEALFLTSAVNAHEGAMKGHDHQHPLGFYSC
jgi:hypothetical protein